MQHIKIINKELIRRTRVKGLKIILFVLSIVMTVVLLVLIGTGGWQYISLYICLLIPAIILIWVFRTPDNIMVEVEEILDELQDGFGIRIARIDRGNLYGTHSEKIVCLRKRMNGIIAYPSEYRLEIFGRPIYHMWKGDKKLTLDTAKEFDKDEDYMLCISCTPDNYQAVLTFLQNSLRKEAVNGEEFHSSQPDFIKENKTVFMLEYPLNKRLFKRVKFHFPRWRKYRWIWYAALLIFLAFNAYWICMAGNEGHWEISNPSFWHDMFILEVVVCILGAIFLPPVYFLLIGGGGESIVPASHKVVFGEDSMCSEWIPDPLQSRNVQGTHVKTVFPYSAMRRIVWNDSLQRLEIYGDYQQQVKDLYSGLWIEKERTYFTLCKTEKVLYLYNYFPGMPKLIEQVQTRCGLEIERI